ncbi:MAG: glycosyltransferase WbuB [Gallionella sp.]|nr:glycosyltransferase WbuB [Gallionella sp.]
MRILIHGINFSPELTGIGKYSGEMAEWLVAQGHEVRVVTAPPYYPQWKVAVGYSGVRYKREFVTASPSTCSGQARARQSRDLVPAAAGGSGWIATSAMPPRNDGMVVYRCPLWVPLRPSGLKRVLHLASFALSSFPIMLRQIFWRPDVVLVVEPPLFCAPQAWLVARLSGGKAWLHIQDYEVDAAFDLGLLKGAALRRWVAACERWLMRGFDRVSTISQRMVERALAKGVAPERVVLFPNWVEITGPRIEASGLSKAGQSGYRAELGITADAVVALYSGNMGGKQGLEILAQVASLCRGFPFPPAPLKEQLAIRLDVKAAKSLVIPLAGEVSSVVFVFCGDGAGRADLVALCDGLPNVRFMDLQPLVRLGELLAMADIHLLPQRADAADLVMPSKLTGMLASGRPVVATAHANTELANVVVGCGLVVEPEQPQAFADAIMKLANDEVLRSRLGAAGRAYAEAHLAGMRCLAGLRRR